MTEALAERFETEQRALRAKCRRWQKILRLQDWDIRLTVVSGAEMPDAYGMVKPDYTRMFADVRILCLRDWQANPSAVWVKAPDFYNRDQETTLVHELLHVLLTHSPQAEGQDHVRQERQCRRLAGALVALDRGTG